MTHEETIQQEIAQALQQAVLQHQTGQWQTAAELYLAILQVDPEHPDANHNQGILLIQTGSPSDALPYLLTALNAQPEQRQYWISYIDALIQTNNAKEAEQILALARQQGLEGEDVAALAARIAISTQENIAPASTRVKTHASSKAKKQPAAKEINILAELLTKGRYPAAADSAQSLSERFPFSGLAWKALGIALMQMGRSAEALAPMKKAAELLPADIDTHNNLGNALNNLGLWKEAENSYRRVLQIKPAYAEVHCNLGNNLRSQGRLAEAEVCYKQALKQKPAYLDALNNLGNMLLEQERYTEAENCFRHALRVDRLYIAAHNNLGVILKKLGRLEEAVISGHRAVEIKPDYAEAHNNLGGTLRELGKRDEAAASFRRALAINPAYAEAASNLGGTLRELGQLEEAATYCSLALKNKPDFAEAYSNLSGVQKELGQLDLAIVNARRATELDANNYNSYSNLGISFHIKGGYEQAISNYCQALTLKPDFTAARMNLGFSQLSCGQLTEGWKNHEFRHGLDRKRFARHPSWAGESLTGKAILIWGEQGVGDEIIFASLYAEVIAQAARCVIECAPKLLPLFTRSFPAATVVAKTEPPHPATLNDLDCQCAAGSLAQWLRPNLASFPLTNTFLIPDPARVAHWQQRLAELGPGPKIGFSWRSSLSTGERALSCTTLAQWEPIFRTPGAHFINLQYDECSAELAEATEKFGIPLHAFTEVDMFNDLDETAALARALDLVITAPTSIYALTAGLGVNTWVMTYGVPWLAHGTDHFPWFPSLRYFSRSWEQTWETVIGTIATQLPSPE